MSTKLKATASYLESQGHSEPSNWIRVIIFIVFWTMKQIKGNAMSQTNDSQSHVPIRDQIMARKNCEVTFTKLMRLIWLMHSRVPNVRDEELQSEVTQTNNHLVLNFSENKTKNIPHLCQTCSPVSQNWGRNNGGCVRGKFSLPAPSEFAWTCYLISRTSLRGRASCVVEDY